MEKARRSRYTVSADDTVTKEIEIDGQTESLELRNELGIGEVRRLAASGVRRTFEKNLDLVANSDTDPEAKVEPSKGKDGKVLAITQRTEVDFDEVAFRKAVTWIASWSLQDDDGQPLPLTVALMRSLRVSVWRVIERAVDEHAAAKKKAEAPGETSDSTPTTPRPEMTS